MAYLDNEHELHVKQWLDTFSPRRSFAGRLRRYHPRRALTTDDRTTLISVALILKKTKDSPYEKIDIYVEEKLHSITKPYDKKKNSFRLPHRIGQDTEHRESSVIKTLNSSDIPDLVPILS